MELKETQWVSEELDKIAARVGPTRVTVKAAIGALLSKHSHVKNVNPTTRNKIARI
jgi:hypothetical protein